MNHYAITSLFASVALLAACGGNGSGGSETPPPPAGSPSAPAPSPAPSAPAPSPAPSGYDARQGWVNLLSTSRSWVVSGVGSDAKSYQLTLATEPAGAAVFPVTGVMATKSNLRNRLLREGALLQDVLNEQFFDSEYRMIGSRVSTDLGTSDCSKTDVVAALPASGVAPGASGPLYAATSLSDCSSTATAQGTSYHTWSLLNDGGVVYLCIASSNRFMGEATDRLSETCVETDAAGTLGQRARIRLVLPGFSVIATN